MKRAIATSIILLLMLSGFFFTIPVGEGQNASDSDAPQEHPYGWTHRPVLEHFTGLSCPPCMSGAHPDATRLWEEEGYSEGLPWNYIEFHELNGGGEDDLMPDESRDRMRYYQPGISGTPSLESDGGYVQLGGSHGSTADANYDDMKSALDDSGNRDAIKKVNIQIGTIYDGIRFSVKVDIDYIQNDEPFIPSPDQPLPDNTLRGILHVFMIEDYVTAWSATNDEFVTTHNVFREYAIEGKEFELQPGESLNDIYADWDVPTTMIRDGAEEPIRVPVNPQNVYPVAVIYDLDDTDSGRGDGSENNDGGDGGGTPRALNSATPASTAYDLNNQPPIIEILEPTSTDGKVQINALIEDDGGELTAAFVVYREVGDNTSQWSYKALTIDGEECTDDVCTIGSGESFAVLNIDDSKSVEFSIMAYDGNWTKGNSEVTVASIDSGDDDGISILMVGSVVIILAIIGALLFVRNSNANAEEEQEEGIDEENEEYDDWEDETKKTDDNENVYSWNEFRSLNKGKSKEEISELWKDYKEDH